MCFLSIPVHYTTCRRRYVTKYIRSISNLHYLSRSSPSALSFCRALELPVCYEQGRLHLDVCIPCFSSCPRADRDVDPPREHCNSSCSLRQPLLHSPPGWTRTASRLCGGAGHAPQRPPR